MTALNRPLRVVLFGGPYLDPPARRFAVLLDAHPDIDLVGILCQADGDGWRFRLYDLWKRRGIVAFPLLARELAGTAARWLCHPADSRSFHARSQRIAAKLWTVPDIHAPDVLMRVRALQADAGAIYGAPILYPALFEIPRFGTLGIHHGRVPDYRGKKTTFWEMYNGEAIAGVTIQRVNSGIDTGDIVARGEVLIGSKSYGRIERETQEIGFELFIEALAALRDGSARFEPQPVATRRIRRFQQPSSADFARFWLRRVLRRLGIRRS